MLVSNINNEHYNATEVPDTQKMWILEATTW